MPVTGNVNLAADLAVLDIALGFRLEADGIYGRSDFLGGDFTFVDLDLGGTDFNGVDVNAIELGERQGDAADAGVAVHAFDLDFL
jgi:hypothetical protein